jgi:glycine/D-amino acid oxidase-like deaminating enzyme
MQGSIVGANHKLGHRLRDLKHTAPSGPRQSLDVLIAGGGMAALSAAWRLSHGGLEDYLMLELESELGGNSRAARYPVSPAPWAAHYLPVPTHESTVVRRILSEMGLLRGLSASGAPLYDELSLCHALEERVYVLGRWEEGIYPRAGASSEDLAQLKRFEDHLLEWQNRRDRKGRKAFAVPLALSSQDPEILALDRISMAQYLRDHGWTSRRLHWYVDYGCRDDYGTSLANTSAWAGLHYFACRDGGGFEPKDTQFVWPEGNHRLVQHLARSLAERARPGQLVVRMQPQSGRWWVDVWNETSQRLEGYSAAHVICALPTFQRPYLLGEKPRPQFTYSPWTVSNLVLEKLPESSFSDSVPLSWDNVIYESPSLGYVAATHQTASHLTGPSVWTHYRPWSELEPSQARRQLLETSWQQACAQVLGDLVRVHPDLPSLCRQLDVMHLGHAMIRPVPGFIWGPHRPLASLPREGLHFAHSDLSGISIFEEASYQGVRAAQEVLQSCARLQEDFLRV